MTRSLHLHWIHPSDPPDAFPDPERALLTPDGLLAAGGDLSPARLLAAYRRGIFPWYEEGQPILWWSPDPRAVFFPDRLHVSRSLRKRLRSGRYEVSIDTDFEGVIDGCAAPRGDDYGDDATWITADMRAAYLRLHELGHTHSVEVWHEDRLIGGVYGVALGRMFFGESMFSRESDASKVALVRLAEELRTRGFGLIDCQLVTGHLERLGSIPLPRPEFVSLVGQLTAGPAPPPGLWTCARTHTVAP